jgi:hypothetical protein
MNLIAHEVGHVLGLREYRRSPQDRSPNLQRIFRLSVHTSSQARP